MVLQHCDLRCMLVPFSVQHRDGQKGIRWIRHPQIAALRNTLQGT